MLFTPIASQTDRRTFSNVINKLTQHTSVMGVLTLGSTASGPISPASDYDLLLILSANPHPLHVLLTTINGRLTDVLFAAEALLARATTPDYQPASVYEAVLLERLRTGKIVFDRNGRVQQAQQLLGDQPQYQPISDETVYDRVLHGINYNYQHNKRYFLSTQPDYHLALDIRLLYKVHPLNFLKRFFLDILYNIQYHVQHDNEQRPA